MDLTKFSPSDIKKIFKLYLETSIDAICILNNRGILVYTNNQAATLLEEPPEKLIGRQIFELIPPSILSRHKKIKNIFKYRRGLYYKEKIITKKGKILSCCLSIRLIRVSKKTYFLIIVHKKQPIDPVDSLKHIYKDTSHINILDIIPELIVIKDKKGNWLLANRATKKIFDINKSYFGKTTRELSYIYPKIKEIIDIDLCEQLEREVVAKKQLLTSEWEIKSGTSRTRYFSIIKKPILSESNQVSIVATTVKEITQFKDMERELKKARRFLETILDSANAFIVVLDSTGRIIRFNNTAERLSGFKEDELIGQYIWDVLMPEEEKKLFVRANTISIESIPTHGENTLITKNGHKKTIVWTGKIIRDDNNQIRWAVVTGIDITRQKEAEEKLKHADKMRALGTMAGGIAHDFNNLLSGIIGNMELLKLKIARSDIMPEIKPLIDNIELATERASAYTKQILQFAKGAPPEKREVTVNDLIPKTLILSTMQEKNRITVHTDMHPRSPIIYADPSQIQQVIYNICLNAIQAMEGKGHLYIKTSTKKQNDKNWCTIQIRDTGCGIDPILKDRIFEPFISSKKGCGTGLGLAISYNIIKNHQGFIDVASSDKGTTFSIYLPLKRIQNSQSST